MSVLVIDISQNIGRHETNAGVERENLVIPECYQIVSIKLPFKSEYGFSNVGFVKH